MRYRCVCSDQEGGRPGALPKGRAAALLAALNRARLSGTLASLWQVLSNTSLEAPLRLLAPARRVDGLSDAPAVAGQADAETTQRLSLSGTTRGRYAQGPVPGSYAGPPKPVLRAFSCETRCFCHDICL